MSYSSSILSLRRFSEAQSRATRLAFDVGGFLKHFIDGLNDLGVRRIGALGLNHVGQLARDIGGGFLTGEGHHIPGRAVTGVPQEKRPAIWRRHEGLLVE